jgi:hypothetical protein
MQIPLYPSPGFMPGPQHYIRPETLKLVQEREGNTLEAIGIGNDSSIELK